MADGEGDDDQEPSSPKPEETPPEPSAHKPQAPPTPVELVFTPISQTDGAAQAVVLQAQFWQGQFPPPDAVEVYERVLPGSFDRMIRMAERQQDAQIDLSGHALRGTRDDTRRGQWLGAGITAGAVVGAVVCAVIHQPVVAGLLVAVPVMSVARAMIESARGRPVQGQVVPVTQPSQTPSTPAKPPVEPTA